MSVAGHCHHRRRRPVNVTAADTCTATAASNTAAASTAAFTFTATATAAATAAATDAAAVIAFIAVLPNSIHEARHQPTKPAFETGEQGPVCE
jgi:hypothetical protein